MVAIQNSDAIQAIREAARLSVSEGFPQQLSMTCVPVMDMTPRNARKLTTFSTSTAITGSASIAAPGAGKRYVIFGYALDLIKDATCDTADGSLSITITQGGISKTLCAINLLTLTAQAVTSALSLPQVVECDENTAIALSSNTFTAGKMRRTITIYGFEQTV